MTDEKKKTMTEEEMAKQWEKMMSQSPTDDKTEDSLLTELSIDKSMDESTISTNSDTFGLSDSIKSQNRTTVAAPNIDFLLDIPLTISAELGRTKMIIYELLQLSQGSVIELDKLAGEPLNVRVNDKLIARGEAVVVNEKFGIRITDIVNPQERIENLKGEK